MGGKLFGPNQYQVLDFTYDASSDSAASGATGTYNLGDLPDSFVVHDCWVVVDESFAGGATITVGEDGGGDADGYFTDIGSAATGNVVESDGALVGASGLIHIVDSAKDGVLVTVSSAAATAGKCKVYFAGHQHIALS